MPPVFKSPISAHHQLFSDILLLAKLHFDRGRPRQALVLCRYALLAAPDLYPQALELLKQAAMDCKDMGAVADALANLPQKAPLTGSPDRPWPYHPVLDLDGLQSIAKDVMDVLPRISVVTVSYNSARYIEETILSVLNQGYPKVEHILIDGGSTDGTMEIVERYRDHLAYIVSEPDEGQADAITKGFRLATGEIATWLNSDDLFMPGALMAMAARFAETGAELVAGVIEAFGDDMESKWHFSPYDKDRLQLADITDIEGRWLQGDFFYQPEVMFTLDLWRRSGGFIDKNIYYCVDWDLWARFSALEARFAKTERHIARYRVHKDQKTYRPESYVPELRRLGRLYRPGVRIVNGAEGVFFLPIGALDGPWPAILEGRETALAAETDFANAYLTTGDCALDIGPGPGLLALRLAAMAGKTGRLLVYDGHEHTHFLLQRTLAAHDLRQAEAIWGFPTEGAGGMLRFDHPAPVGGDDAPFGFARAHAEGTGVPARPIDPARMADHRIAFIHLDAAGVELLILQGLQDLLARHRPALLIKADPMRLATFGMDRKGLGQLLGGWGYDVEALGEGCYIKAVIKGG